MDDRDKRYHELLNKLYEKVKRVETTERFEIPKVEGHIEGNKTIIDNFQQIADILRRPKEHIIKFLSRELAALATLDNERLIFNKKILRSKLDEKVEAYAKEFVICKECGKPDTELIREKGFVFLHCLACGAKQAVRAKIH